MSAVLNRCAMLGVLLALGALATGCGQPSSDGGSSQVSQASGDDHAGHDHDGEAHEEGDGHDHGGWWCVEHGVPEEDCSICSSDAAAKFKEKGDWCEEHNRAESQCFKCDPSRAEKFAKLYEAKFGHKPPAPKE